MPHHRLFQHDCALACVSGHPDRGPGAAVEAEAARQSERELARAGRPPPPLLSAKLGGSATWLILPVAYACLKD